VNLLQPTAYHGKRELRAALILTLLLANGLNSDVSAQSILPPHPEAKGGGNPLQGLGRKDDPYPARYDDFLPKNQSESSETGTDGQEQPLGESLPEQKLDTGVLEELNKQATDKGFSLESAPEGLTQIQSPDTVPPPENSGLAQGSGPDGLPPEAEKLMQTETGSAATTQPSSAVSKDRTTRSEVKTSPKSQEITDRIRSALAKHAALQQPKKAEPPAQKHQLVPPPPPSIDAAVARDNPNSPERQALGLIHKGEYAAAEQAMRDLVAADPINLHARYLLAVALVYRKKYDEARTCYNLILEKSKDQKLRDLADAGLKKLGR